MASANNKNHTIELLRFIFAVLIILYHSYQYLFARQDLLIFKHSYLGDEFFFIVSGFFIANSVFKSNLQKSNWEILRSRFTTIKWPYYISWLGAFVGLNLVSDLETLLGNLLHSIPELCFIDMCGFKEGFYANPVAWYVYALFFTVVITVPIIKRYGLSFCYYCAPVLSLMFYGILNLNYDVLNAPHQIMFGFIHKGLVRCFAGCFAGFFIFSLTKESSIKIWLDNHLRVASLFQMLSFILVIMYCVSPIENSYDFSVVVLMIVFLSITMICNPNENIVKKIPFVLKLGRFSVYMFLGQAVFYAVLHNVVEFRCCNIVWLPLYFDKLFWFYNDDVSVYLRAFVFFLMCVLSSVAVLGCEKIIKYVFIKAGRKVF